MFGYAHPGYAESLAEFGTPRAMGHCGGQVLMREVPGFGCRDAMGCYPLFACADWTALPRDIEALAEEAVCLTLVADPFGKWDENLLRSCFPDLCVPFKDHLVTELDRPIEKIASRHHRYYARKALEEVAIDTVADPVAFCDEWVDLYAVLAERFGLKGIKAFSPRAFARQLVVPGLVAFRAMAGGKVVGAQLWYVQGEVAYGHLAAWTQLGYQMSVAYALYWHALEYFTGRVRWMDNGAAAGVGGDGKDGLTFFKRGWSTGTRLAYLCGRVFDRRRYEEITATKGLPLEGYFPAYRRGELA